MAYLCVKNAQTKGSGARDERINAFSFCVVKTAVPTPKACTTSMTMRTAANIPSRRRNRRRIYKARSKSANDGDCKSETHWAPMNQCALCRVIPFATLVFLVAKKGGPRSDGSPMLPNITIRYLRTLETVGNNGTGGSYVLSEKWAEAGSSTHGVGVAIRRWLLPLWQWGRRLACKRRARLRVSLRWRAAI